MTTTVYTPFQPTQNANFQFQPILDGLAYNAVVTWALFGKRYYLNLFTLTGQRILTKALIGSPAGVNIQSLNWLEGMATVTTITPHGFKIGATLEITIKNVIPSGYNGTFIALAINPLQLTFSLPTYPGSISQEGAVTRDINIVKSYFKTSSLVYRAPSQQFEVTSP